MTTLRPGAIILALSLCCGLVPAVSRADALMDRYRDASLAIEARLWAFYSTRVPELAPVLPTMGWDDEIAAIAACTLDGIRADQGDAGVEAFVAAFEVFAATPITSLATFGQGQSPVLSQPIILELAQSCGSFALTARRMRESGMTALIESDPSIAERLAVE